MKKRTGFIVEVTSRLDNETLEKIFVSRTKVLRYDERTYPHIMQANAIFIAKREFCKANNLDERTAGKDFRFEMIETLK